MADKSYLQHLKLLMAAAIGHQRPATVQVPVLRRPALEVFRLRGTPQAFLLDAVPFEGCVSAGSRPGEEPTYPVMVIPGGFMAVHPTTMKLAILRPQATRPQGFYVAETPEVWFNNLTALVWSSTVTNSTEMTIRKADVWWMFAQLLPDGHPLKTSRAEQIERHAKRRLQQKLAAAQSQRRRSIVPSKK